MNEDKDLSEFEEQAKRDLMSFLASRGMKMTDLLIWLKANSVEEKYGGLAQKINRGKFSYAWLKSIVSLLGYEVKIVRNDSLDERVEVIEHIMDNHGLMIGHNSADRLIKAVRRAKIPQELEVAGLDTVEGQPTKKVIPTGELFEILDL